MCPPSGRHSEDNMRKSEENDLLWETYLLESPWHMKHPLNSFDKDMENLNYFDISQDQPFDKFGDIEVFKNDLDGKQFEFYFALDQKIVSYCRCKMGENGMIVLDLIWNSKKSKGLFRKIFVEYLLPEFGDIESGDSMSDLGFGFFKNLMDTNPDLKFYVRNGGNITKIQDSSEFEKYKEPLRDDNQYSTFIVTE